MMTLNIRVKVFSLWSVFLIFLNSVTSGRFIYEERCMMICIWSQIILLKRIGRPLRVGLISTTLMLGCSSVASQVPCDPPRLPAPGLPQKGISAHRGGELGCPENTLGAFRRAICLGVHQIELDVRATADAKLVVAHDDHMTGTDGRTVQISQSTLAEVQGIRVGACTGDMTCEQFIPTLEKVLHIMPQNIWINIDVKKNNPQVARLVVEAVDKAQRFDQVIFGVRNDAAAAVRQLEQELGHKSWVSNMSREIFRCQYVDTTIASCDEFIQLVYLPYLLRGKPSHETINQLKQAGVRVNYSWVREKDETELRQELEDLFVRGVNFVLVDHPEAAMKAARTLGISPLVPSWKQSKSLFSCSEPPRCDNRP